MNKNELLHANIDEIVLYFLCSFWFIIFSKPNVIFWNNLKIWANEMSPLRNDIRRKQNGFCSFGDDIGYNIIYYMFYRLSMCICEVSSACMCAGSSSCSLISAMLASVRLRSYGWVTRVLDVKSSTRIVKTKNSTYLTKHIGGLDAVAVMPFLNVCQC